MQLGDGLARAGDTGIKLGHVAFLFGNIAAQCQHPVARDDAGCQASLLRYTWPDRDGGKSRILYSKGATPDRRVGTIRVSYDEAKTWPVAKVVCEDYFGYSCLTAMPDGTIGCLFETANCSKITFTKFSLEWLTDGHDSLNR